MEERIIKMLEAMNEKIESMDKSLDAMDKRLDTMDKRLDVMDKRLDTMDKRLDVMDKDIKDIKEGQIRLEKKIDDVHEQVFILTEWKTTVDTKFEAIKKAVS